MTRQKHQKIEQHLLRYTRHPSKKLKRDQEVVNTFDCDKHLQRRSRYNRRKVSFRTASLHNFTAFRPHFYNTNHERIKSSLKHRNDIEIVNIRLAPINKSVQNDFMKRLNENTSYNPHLVYHGTKLNNIQGIVQYGFLIPNERHLTNGKTPIIINQLLMNN